MRARALGRGTIVALAVWLYLTVGGSLQSSAARFKDIASVKGVRENQLIGYGLIVGLNGTGDKNGTEFTIQSLVSMLTKMGIGVDPSAVKVKNVAAVMVTSMLAPFSRTGSRIDVTLSSIGDAQSIEGGTLLMTPMFGADGKVYAIAQGPISVGGFSAGGGGGGGVQKNHPTVGRIAGGATVETELNFSMDMQSEFEISLNRPDFTTALRTAKAINARFEETTARAIDAGTLMVTVPDRYAVSIVEFMAELEALEIEPDYGAVIVLNERTGTVVMGSEVHIDTVAVSHGSLSIVVSVNREASQPGPLSRGETVLVENRDITAFEEPGGLSLVGGRVTIGELVRGLNAMGVTPRDLIAILQAIKVSGALSADLVMM